MTLLVLGFDRRKTMCVRWKRSCKSPGFWKFYRKAHPGISRKSILVSRIA